MILLKKRTAPYSYFCGPQPQKNVFERVHAVSSQSEGAYTIYAGRRLLIIEAGRSSAWQKKIQKSRDNILCILY